MKTHQMSVNASAMREIPAARKGRPVERRDAESLEEEEGRGEGPVGRPAHANDLLRPEEDLAATSLDCALGTNFRAPAAPPG